MNYVYQFVDGKEVLYIGKSDRSDFKRIREHGKNHDNIPKEAHERINHADIYITLLCNSTMSDVVESELIRRYRPPYNKAKQSEWSGLDFPEIKWIPFRINGEEVYRENFDHAITNPEMGIEKFDYCKAYSEYAKKVSNLQNELKCLNQTNISLSKSIETLKDELRRTKSNETLIEELRRAKSEAVMKRSEEAIKSYNMFNESICIYNKLSEAYNNLLMKYNEVVRENKSLKAKRVFNTTTSIWKKYFQNRKLHKRKENSNEQAHLC